MIRNGISKEKKLHIQTDKISRKTRTVNRTNSSFQTGSHSATFTDKSSSTYFYLFFYYYKTKHKAKLAATPLII